MATKKETAEFLAALERGAEVHAGLKALGTTPTRAQLLGLLEAQAPVIAAGMQETPRALLVEAIVATAGAAQEPPEVTKPFGTRLPVTLIADVKHAATTRGMSVQELVANALRAYIED